MADRKSVDNMGKKRVMIVDDDEHTLTLLKKRLSDSGYEVSVLLDGREVASKVREFAPDILLLDIRMPGIDGMAIKAELDKAAVTAGMPVIFLTAMADTADKVKGLRAGVDEYITKPFDSEELLARIDSALRRKAAYEEIAMTDGLTGLYNARFFNRQLAIFFRLAKRYNKPFSVAIIDVNNLKAINDAHGHATGDAVLRKIAAILRESLRKADIITRYSSDEFVIILPESTEEMTATAMERISEKIKQSLFISEETGVKVFFSVTIGAAAYKEEFTKESQVFELADANIYKQKHAGM